MAEQVALVTGASSGIGAASARMLASEGYYVFAAARSLERLQPLRAENVEPLTLDVTVDESVRAATDHIRSRMGRVDVLVNSAGYGAYGVVEGVTLEEARRQFDVNVFGAMAVIKAVLPMMRAQNSGRIVQLGSIVGYISVPVLGWYAASKHAVKALMDALRLEVEPFGIHVVMIDPGALASGFEEVAFASLEEAKAPAGYEPVVEGFTRRMRRDYARSPGPEAVLPAIRKAITVDNPKAAYTDRLETGIRKTARHLLSDRVFDWILRQRLK